MGVYCYTLRSKTKELAGRKIAQLLELRSCLK